MSLSVQATIELHTRRAQAAAEGFSSCIRRLVAQFAGLTGVGLSVRSMLSGLTGALEIGSRTQDLSVVTGVAVRDRVILRQAFQAAGARAESVQTAIF